jgi:16S rRNA (guanine527-N7)-methyltransferase
MNDWPEDGVARLGVSRETIDRLRHLADLLVRWNARINLVAPSSLDDLWRRHIADSAQLWSLRPPSARSWVDLGSGAGFPGLVIAAIARDAAPSLAVELVESDSRKCAFLREASRVMDTPCTVRCARIEDVPAGTRDVISARALAPLARLLPMAARFIGPDSVCLFPKGRHVEAELTEVRRSWHTRTVVVPSATDPGGAILAISEICRADT